MQNDWKRWLLRYAVELLVIFTGITASFAFEQWRKERDDRAEERKVLAGLHRDLSRKQQELESDSAGLSYLAGVIDSLRRNVPAPNDAHYVEWVSFAWRTEYLFNPSTAAYKIVTETGKLSLISSDSLQSALVELHEYSFPSAAIGYTHHQEFDRARFKPIARQIPWHTQGKASEHRRAVSQLLARPEPNDALYWKGYICSAHRAYIRNCLVELRHTLRVLEAERQRLGPN